MASGRAGKFFAAQERKRAFAPGQSPGKIVAAQPRSNRSIALLNTRSQILIQEKTSQPCRVRGTLRAAQMMGKEHPISQKFLVIPLKRGARECADHKSQSTCLIWV